MKAANVEKIIKDIIEQKTQCKSVLIDGRWGCGKTTAVKEAIKNISNASSKKGPKIVYQSLFGIKDVAELSGCYSQVGKILYSLGKSVVTPFTSLIPIVGNQISESIDNASNLYEPKPAQKKNCIFVFDDLERTDKDLSFISLLGFFNQLLLRGCIIICISSLNDIEKINNNSERKEDMETFVEKAFDRIFYINDSPSEAILDIFKNIDFDSSIVEPCINMFDDNLRIAIKVRRLLFDIKNNADSYGYKLDGKFSNLQMLKAAICSIRSIYLKYSLTSLEKSTSKNELDDLEDYESTSVFVNEHLNNEIKRYKDFYLTKGEEFEIKELSRCFCYADVHDDYTELSKSYPKNIYEDKVHSGLLESLFYLSDEDKIKQFDLFKEKVNKNSLPIDRWFADKLIDLIRFGAFDWNDGNLLNIIIEKIASAASNGNDDAFTRIYDYVSFPTESGNDVLVANIYKDIEKIVQKNKCNKFIETVNSCYNNDNYDELTKIAYDSKNNNLPLFIKNQFSKLLLDNGFYLPDLSKTISYVQWSYCHEIAKLSMNDSMLKNNFMFQMIDVVREHKDSKTAIEKAKALIEYNFDADSLKVFNEQIKHLIQ